MNITLTPDSEQYLREQLASGKFPSPDDVIAEALRRMRAYDQKMDELRRDIAAGIEQADQGLATEFTEATLERVKTKARQQAQAMP
jgi:putative addiction module CopG family antidote